MRRISVSSPSPCITLPAPKNSSALDTPCATRCSIAAASPPAPSASIISPKWLTVEYASARFMSVITSASAPAYKNVISPTTDTAVIAPGAISNSGSIRATRYTPAATIVAACISALTGVGPSIASGSHT